jgi:cysteine desulfurase
MRKVYLDNAATTALRPEVIETISRSLATDFGNPSSTHSYGRQARSSIEMARKAIAGQLKCSAQEIIFTSGGTEANNWILRSAAGNLNIKRIITSKIEHHAVLYAVQEVATEFDLKVDYVNLLPGGKIDLNHLNSLLSENILTLVTLMHVNNEIGTELNLVETGNLCRKYNAYFHSDTVQSVGKICFELDGLPVDFIVASAHKFHGPKGIGFAFVRKGIALRPIIHGGEQEKGLRAGTESVHNICGMAHALDLAYQHLDVEKEQIGQLKAYATKQIMQHFPDAKINGIDTFYNVLNVCFPFDEAKTAMILFTLDMKGFALSRGSACQSGSTKPSHVLAEILDEADLKKPSLRISFSHQNTREDIDDFIAALLEV